MLKFLKSNSFSATLIVVSSFWTACAKLERDPSEKGVGLSVAPSSTNLNNPEFTQDQRSFTGSLILWSPQVTAEELAKVARLSKQIGQLSILKLKYIETELLSLEASFKEALDSLNSKQVSAQSFLSSLTAAGFATFLLGRDKDTPGFMQRAQKRLELADLNSAISLLSKYCEAKIWQRAAFFATAPYEYGKSRPSPHILCEGFYQAKGLLSRNSRACANGDAFACLWQEGVFKTNLFSQAFPTGSPSRSEMENLSYNHADAFRRFLTEVEFERPDLAFLKGQGSWVIHLDSQGETEVELNFRDRLAIPPIEIISKLEASADPGVEFRFFSEVSPQFELEARALEKEIRNYLRQAGAYLYSDQGSATELFFNSPLRVDALPKGQPSEQQKTDFFSHFEEVTALAKSNAEFQKLLGEASQSAQALKKILGTISERSKTLIDVSDCPRSKTFACQDLELRKASKESVSSPNVTLATLPSTLKFQGDKEGLVVSWFPNLSLGQSSPLEVYLESENSENFGLERLSPSGIGLGRFDAESELLELKFHKINTSLANLTPQSREEFTQGNAIGFSELDENLWTGSTLSLVFSLDKVAGMVDVATGSLSLQEENGSIHPVHGSLKLIDNEPPILLRWLAFKRRIDEVVNRLKSST